MRSSKVLSNNPYVSDKNLAEKYVVAHKYNQLYDDVADKSTGKLNVVKAATSVTRLTADDHGKVIYFDAASVSVMYWLPDPVVGLKFTFIWIANNDNDQIIRTADITDTTGDMLCGGVLVCYLANNNLFVEAGANVNTIALDDNDTGQGGGSGSWIELTCVEDAVWHVTGIVNGNTSAAGDGTGIFTNLD